MPDTQRFASGLLDITDQRSFARALGEPRRPVAGVHNGKGREAGHRIAVYRNNVVGSLSDALAATYPVTRQLMGEGFFRTAAVEYAHTRRAPSPILWQYGLDFAEEIAGLDGLRDYPFVPEVARIEAARVRAYHAGDAAQLSPKALLSIDQAKLDTLKLRRHPAASIVWTPDGGLAAWQQSQVPPQPTQDATAALVTRPSMTVMVTGLTTPEAAFVTALFEGAPLSEAAAVDGLDLTEALATVLSRGAFCGLGVAHTS